ncbi:SNF2 family N-terminal domain-containing protein [Xylariaceae sp. FL0662B]|nr:SNF2 family N-terminal domain-containing protein [Xylariaceae sp. FL0662B]
MAPAKRRPPVTSSTGEPRTKVARHGNRSVTKSSSQTTASSSSQSSRSHQSAPSSLGRSGQYLPRSSWVEEDDDGGMIDLTQDVDDPVPPIELYGSMDNKIVGVRYYNGVVTPSEMIICRREPANPYDRNAIRVDNVMGVQIGHLPRNLVEKLAPYIDKKEIVLEGILTGEKDYFDCPVRLYLYGTSIPSARIELENKLKADKLLKATQLKATRKEAEAQRNADMGLKNSSVGLGTARRAEQEDELDAFLAASEAMDSRVDLDSLDLFAMDEDTLSKLPKADQPESIRSKLLPYQLQGLAWMATKENPQLPAPGSGDIVQLWKRDKRGNFFNLASSHTTHTRPKLLSGGVLADDMGLGKTLQVISLILTSGFGEGPTLIVAPPGVMSNWEQQIQQHVKTDRIPRVWRYHKMPAGVSMKENDFLQHDIVITSYGKLRTDYNRKSKSNALFSVNWRRVILDEGHQIRNPSTTLAKAAYELQAKSRWVLTGTPIINTPNDFQSALKFLKITGGMENAALFKSKIGDRLRPGRPSTSVDYKEATALFQSLTSDLCLRRRKDMEFVDLKLPAKKEFTHQITFRKDERAKYDALFSEAVDLLESFRRKPKKGAKSKQGAQIRFSNVLEKLLRLRQMCCHWTLCGDRVGDILQRLDDEEVVKFTPENLRILQDALRVATKDGEECPICIEALEGHQPVITACKHRFGRPCISRVIEMYGKCPMCRQELTMDSIVDLEPADDDFVFDGDSRSSKTEVLEEFVKAKLKTPESKIIVFSQWTSFLDIIARVLVEAGFGYCRLDGTMSTTQRDKAIEILNTSSSTRIMLASLHVSSVGLNLVAADTVVLADCWWAPAIEEQAIDRVHRLGQTRETTVLRLVMADSVEQRVLKIQDEKRELTTLAFHDKAKDQKEVTRLDDVVKLLS